MVRGGGGGGGGGVLLCTSPLPYTHILSKVSPPFSQVNRDSWIYIICARNF